MDLTSRTLLKITSRGLTLQAPAYTPIPGATLPTPTTIIQEASTSMHTVFSRPCWLLYRPPVLAALSPRSSACSYVSTRAPDMLILFAAANQGQSRIPFNLRATFSNRNISTIPPHAASANSAAGARSRCQQAPTARRLSAPPARARTALPLVPVRAVCR